jgi:DNA-binding response OmpR family regulator
MAKPMVLVVDDQPEYARLISLSLAREGFEVRTASGGEEAIDSAAVLHPDVVLLDINMPGLDGFQVMAELRVRWPVPIIMVTGDDTPPQRRAGLDRGADDYVTKPFSPRELAARVRAQLRRPGTTGGTNAGILAPMRVPAPTDGLRSGRSVSVPTVSGRIGRRAARLLDLLSSNPGKVLYHDELLAHAFGPAFAGDTALLQEEIRRLRRALGIPARSEGAIRTVRGVGYTFDGPGARAADGSGRRREPAAPGAVGRE